MWGLDSYGPTISGTVLVYIMTYNIIVCIMHLFLFVFVSVLKLGDWKSLFSGVSGRVLVLVL